jgi:integrase
MALAGGLVMARKPKPWWHSERGTYFVCIGGERYNLGADEDDADREFHRLLSLTPEERRPKVSAPLADGISVAAVLDKFLDHVEKHRAATTYAWYKDRLQWFTDTLEKPDEMPASSVKPYMVVEWADSHANWGACYRRGCIGAIQTAFRWAVRLGHMDASPISFVEKPAATRREQVVTEADWIAIRDHYEQDDPFRRLLTFAWSTGCRPQEVRCIEARHVDLPRHRIVFPAKEAKGKKRPRIIYMTPEAERIIRDLMKERPKGMLFRNAHGKPWTCYAVSCRFGRLKKHVGVKWAAYSFRHGFATRKLEGGIDHITVAALMGHTDATMLSKVYSHVGDRPEYLREQLNRESERKDA